MVLILWEDQLQAMTAQAAQTYPEECCGLLLGTWDVKCDRRQVYEVKLLANQWTVESNPFAATPSLDAPQSKQNRFWVDPRDLMTAQRQGRDQGWIILGVYHSHPNHPAVPSERDRQLAWPEYSYPIVSVTNGQVSDIQSWRLDGAGDFQPEVIHVSARFSGL